jgi:hypothetical protein
VTRRKHPRVIETIPKAGYLLIAPIDRRQPGGAEPQPPVRVRVAPGWPLLAAALGSLVLIQLTAFRGLERSPAFSPDATERRGNSDCSPISSVKAAHLTTIEIQSPKLTTRQYQRRPT